MANNEITVRRNYEDGKEECRSSESRYSGLEFYYTENIEILNRKAFESGLKSVIGKVGDATKPENIPSQYFNVVLCLGPRYHLPPNERELVFAECKRICKSDGIAVFAYINKIGIDQAKRGILLEHEEE